MRRFGSRGQGPAKFANPHSVITTSSLGRTLQHVSQSVRGLSLHPSGRLLAIAKNHSIEVFNLDLSHSQSLSELKQFVDACDLAVDSKGMVYVLTIKHGIHKFSSDLKKTTILVSTSKISLRIPALLVSALTRMTISM